MIFPASRIRFAYLNSTMFISNRIALLQLWNAVVTTSSNLTEGWYAVLTQALPCKHSRFLVYVLLLQFNPSLLLTVFSLALKLTLNRQRRISKNWYHISCFRNEHKWTCVSEIWRQSIYSESNYVPKLTSSSLSSLLFSFNLNDNDITPHLYNVLKFEMQFSDSFMGHLSNKRRK